MAYVKLNYDGRPQRKISCSKCNAAWLVCIGGDSIPHKNRHHLLWLVLILAIFPMPGQAGILEDINKMYISHINQLPYSSGSPEKNIQTSGHISGWVDIVGFRQMIRDKGIDYVPGSPADYAIVQYDAWAKLDCEGCSLESLTKSIAVSTSGNRTLAALSV